MHRRFGLFHGTHQRDIWLRNAIREAVLSISIACVFVSNIGSHPDTVSVSLAYTVTLLIYGQMNDMKHNWYQVGAWRPWLWGLFCTFGMSAWNVVLGSFSKAFHYNDAKTVMSLIYPAYTTIAAIFTIGMCNAYFALKQYRAKEARMVVVQDLGRPTMQIVMSCVQTALAVVCMMVAMVGFPCQTPLKGGGASIYLLVLFNSDVMLYLANELWAYGSYLGAAVNGVFLVLDGLLCLVVNLIPGGPCQQQPYMMKFGLGVCMGYVVCMVVVTARVYKMDPPEQGREWSLQELRWKAIAKEAVACLFICLVLCSLIGYNCDQDGHIVLVVQAVSLSVFSLSTDAAEDCAEADLLVGTISNHLLSIIGLLMMGVSGSWTSIHGYDSCYAQTGIVSYVCFSLGITATTTITTMIEAYAANQSHQEDHIYALTCRRLDLLLKSLAAVIGIMSLAVSLLGIPCNDGGLGPSMSLTQSNSNPTEIIQISSLFAISIGLEMFNKLWEWRFYYSAAINALLTLYSSLLTLVTGLVWRALSGITLNHIWAVVYASGDAKAPISQINCSTQDKTRYIGMAIAIVYVSCMTVTIIRFVLSPQIHPDWLVIASHRRSRRKQSPHVDNNSSTNTTVTTTSSSMWEEERDYNSHHPPSSPVAGSNFLSSAPIIRGAQIFPALDIDEENSHYRSSLTKQAQGEHYRSSLTKQVQGEHKGMEIAIG